MEMKPLIPFEPISTTHKPPGENWVTQIKWDGVRMLTYYDGRETKLYNRKKNERTLQYPEFQQVREFCRADSVILDGEFIAFDQSKPSFHEIMRRDALKQEAKIKASVSVVPVTYMIFDILYLNGEWVTDRPLAVRQRLLQERIIPSNHVQVVPNVEDGDALFHLMKQHRMEGVVHKDLTSTYTLDGKDGRWRKQKVFQDLYAAVGGVTYRGKTVNALMLGLYTDRGELLYIGHAGTGKLTQKDWAEVTAMAQRLSTETKPFANQPERSKEAVWLRPELMVKVEYLEFTPGGTLRHPSIQAILEADVKACTFEQL